MINKIAKEELKQVKRELYIMGEDFNEKNIYRRAKKYTKELKRICPSHSKSGKKNKSKKLIQLVKDCGYNLVNND